MLILSAAVVYAILYMQFTAFPIVFTLSRGWSPSISGLAFIPLTIGAFLALAGLGVANKSYARKLEAAGGYLPPEARLPSVIVGAMLLPCVSTIHCFHILPGRETATSRYRADAQSWLVHVRVDLLPSDDPLDRAHDSHAPLWRGYRGPLPWHHGTSHLQPTVQCYPDQEAVRTQP